MARERVIVVVQLTSQHVLCPAKACGGAQVKLALQVVFAVRQYQQVLGPTDFSNQRLEFWLVVVFVEKLPHRPQVLCRKPVASRKLGLNVVQLTSRVTFRFASLTRTTPKRATITIRHSLALRFACLLL